jgi:hypothetical protein
MVLASHWMLIVDRLLCAHLIFHIYATMDHVLVVSPYVQRPLDVVLAYSNVTMVLVQNQKHHVQQLLESVLRKTLPCALPENVFQTLLTVLMPVTLAQPQLNHSNVTMEDA